MFFEPAENPLQVVQEMVGYAHKARRNGIVSLDKELDRIKDPFLKKSLMLAVDGTEPDELRGIMQLELDNVASATTTFRGFSNPRAAFPPPWESSERSWA